MASDATETDRLGERPPVEQQGDKGHPDPVVLRDDPAPVRALTAWRRAGRSEGTRNEFNLFRACGLAIAIGLIWQWAPGAVAFIGILSVLVFLHELGHYAVARRVGMRPTEFFIGFGPTVWARTASNGLRYGVKLIPAGGYVKLPGMGPREEVEASLEPYTYRAASRRNRMLVILAGVAVNFLIAVALFAGYAAVEADAGPVEAAGVGVSRTTQVATGTLDGLGTLVFGADDYAKSVASGEVPENRLVSPIGGAQIADGLMEGDASRLWLLAAIFSASLALLNLLPLLPLDGGHAALIVVESAWARIRRKRDLRLDPNKFTPVAVAVVAVLVTISASAMYLDILHPLGDAVR
ncbi:MAG: site-2 protease family protein [Actinomycetia bacterium]|nr:site-2 protease family protein [Actinomycetes bacterium]